MGSGLLSVKSGFILFIKSYQFPLQINTLERERESQGQKYTVVLSVSGVTDRSVRLRMSNQFTYTHERLRERLSRVVRRRGSVWVYVTPEQDGVRWFDALCDDHVFSDRWGCSEVSQQVPSGDRGSA
jgi:hypothetical protein